jgi:CheY-like chemotaxis protein
MKVIVVDDETDVRRVARLCLTRVGKMDVLDVASGLEAVNLAQREQPDAIVLDVMMPAMDGPATLLALRANPATAAIPVIFLTAKSAGTEMTRLRSLGAAGVLSKPFDPMGFAADVRALVEGA